MRHYDMSNEKALVPLESPVDDTGLNRQDSHAETPSPAKSIITDKEQTTQSVVDFPEGGRGWWVAAGSAGMCVFIVFTIPMILS